MMTNIVPVSPYSPQPSAATRSSSTNGLAIAALIVVFFASLVGLILGYIALAQIKQTHQAGRGLALAAVVIGWIGTVLPLLAGALFFAGSYVFRLY